MSKMSVDIETYSSIDLSKTGVYRYVEAPDFDILLIGFSIDGGPVEVIDCTARHNNYEEEKKMVQFKKHLYDPECIKKAFNANFERTCLAKWTGREMPPEQWRCTMIKCLTMGLPGNLAGAGMALGLPEDKLKDPQGKALIQYFSKPCKPTRVNGQRTRNLPEHDPDKWKLYIEYNRQDVVTEMAIDSKPEIYKTTETEQELWNLDQRMNDHGVRIDVDMVDKIVDYDTVRKEELQKEAQEITGLANPNSLAQLKTWLNDQGMPMTSATKDTISAALALKYIPDNVRRVLEIRTALGKTSTAKYSTMLDAVCEDHRLRGILQFYGANRSGRWAGRLVQTHNLARNSLEDLDLARELAVDGDFDTMQTLFGETAFVFSELVRTAFIPSEGCRFVVSDFFDRKDFSKPLQIANRKHDVVAVQIYDALCRELPDVGLLKVSDAETGHEMVVDTSDKKIRAAHRNYFLNRQHRLSDTFHKSLVDWVSIATDEDYVKKLMLLFKQRS